MPSVALVRTLGISDVDSMRMTLGRLVRNEISRHQIVMDFPIRLTPRKWHIGTLACFVRSGRMSINGYVAVPESHPWYKVHFTECPIKCGEDWCGHSPETLIEVHGGLTYSGLSVEGWVFGFDTAHAWD